MQEKLTPDIYKHCVIVLTKARAKFEGKKGVKSLTNFISAEKERNGKFAHLIAKVSDRVVAVENDFMEDAIAVLHRQTFLRYLMTIVDQKRGKCFSHRLFIEVERRIRQDEIERQVRIQRAQQLSQMEYRVEKFLYDSFLETLSVENLNQIPTIFEHCVDGIRKGANLTPLNYVDRNDVLNFLKKFAQQNKGYIQKLSQMKLKERKLQQEKRARDEINAFKVGAYLPSFLRCEGESRLKEFAACLDQKDLSRVNDLLSQYARVLLSNNQVSTDMGDITVLLQGYCLTNTDIVKETIQSIFDIRAKMKQIEDKRIQDEKRNKVLAKISKIVDKDLDSYLMNKTVEELNEIEKQLQNNQVPRDIFERVKSTLPNEEIVLDDISIATEILHQISARKSSIDKFKKKAGKCFAGSALVQTKCNGSKEISTVRINDEILVFDDDGHLFYDKVYIILHANAKEEVLYVRIATKQGKILFISPYHALPVGEIGKDIPAKDVVVGDAIFTINHGFLTLDIVTSVSYKLCKGAFCPVTMNGNIVVNEVAASCYTTFVNPSLTHFTLLPFRVMYKYFPCSVFNKMLPYDSVEGMPLIIGFSRAVVNFARSYMGYLRLT